MIKHNACPEPRHIAGCLVAVPVMAVTLMPGATLAALAPHAAIAVFATHAVSYISL